MWTANHRGLALGGKRRQWGLEIIVDGKTRSFRDARDAVIEAGKYLKAHHRQSEISIRIIPRPSSAGKKVKRLFGLEKRQFEAGPRTLTSYCAPDLVIYEQLAALSIGDLKIVTPRMHLRFVNVLFQRLMPPFESRTMRLHGQC
jgi:hypothetical protein